MREKPFRKLTALFLAALLLTGCAKSDFSEAASETAVSQTADSGGITEYNSKSSAEGAEVMMDIDADDAAGNESPAEAAEKNASSRKLIKTVVLSIDTKDFDDLRKQVEEKVSSFEGYIESSDFSVNPGTKSRNYALIVRIPVDKLDTFVDETGWKGTITSKSENIEDVTLDYVDKTAYKESLQTEYDRVTELLEKAKDLDQILALESKLSQLRYELNSYESQLRIYDNQIDYSTVHIYISEVEYESETSYTVGSRINSGFRSSLYAIRDFFVNLFVAVVSNLPILLLWAVFIAIVILFIRKFQKRFPKKSKSSKKEEQAEQPKE